MANSTAGIIDTLAVGQASKETTVNAALDAAYPSMLFGRRASGCSGLTWCFYGGTLLVDGVATQVYLSSSNTLTLSASTTNYIEATRAGVVSKNTTGFTPGSIPLYSVVTGVSTVVSYIDYRIQSIPSTGRLAKAMSDANTTLTAAEARNQILEFTGTLTAARNIIVPIGAQQWTVFNNTTGGFGLQFIGASGTGVTVASGKRAIVYADGTNVVRVTADA